MMEVTYKTIRTPLLEIVYLEAGPADGKPLVLLHGWPDSPLTWSAVAAPLADQGWHVFAPTLRGYGATRFLDAATLRSGQITALAQDALDFADALALGRFTLVGHDWGGRAAYQVAANWPQRLERLITLSVPYHSSSLISQLRPQQQRAYWYQWLLQTNQARSVLEHSRRELCQELWQTWMAPGAFDQAAFDETAPAWENPDWIAITLSSYRFRWKNAAGDPRYDALEAVQLAQPKITVPTLLLHGELDGATLPQTTEDEDNYFSAGYQRLVVAGAGHFIQREKPQAVIDALLSKDNASYLREYVLR